MKKRISMSIFVLSLFAIALASCSKSTNNPVSNSNKPDPIGVLKASSAGATAVNLSWDHSASQSQSNFDGYQVSIPAQPSIQPVNVTKDKNSLTFSGLTEGNAYEFHVVSKTTDGKTSDPIKISWAPAKVYTMDPKNPTQTLRIYESSSSTNNGLNLYNDVDQSPESTSLDSYKDWSVGLDTKTAGKIYFGTADQLSYAENETETPQSVEMAQPVQGSIETSGSSKSLDQLSYAKIKVDLNQYSSNQVFVIKAKDAQNVDHFAKVETVYKNGSWLQNDPVKNAKYVEIRVSYQKTALPYAK